LFQTLTTTIKKRQQQIINGIDASKINLIAAKMKKLPTDLADRSAKDAGYFFVRIEGYIYRNQQSDENLVPLKLYYSDAREEFFTIATEEGISDAERAGYNWTS
jgi:hypothetical protein